MTAIELKTIITTLLSDDLGTFTTSTGKTYPAIRITPPRIDPKWKVTGLQVSIYANPDSKGTEPLTGEKLERQWWNLDLVQFDDKKTTQVAIDKIKSYFPRVTVRVKSPTTDSFESAFISIYIPTFLGESLCYQQ